MIERFKHDYIEFDQFGLKEIRCMASGKVIAQREECPSKKFPGRTLFQLHKFADYKEVPCLLVDGSIAFLMFCDEHKNSDIGEEEAALVSDQIRRAKILEMKNSGKTDEFISKVMSNFEKKHVVRRLTSDEVGERLSKISL